MVNLIDTVVITIIICVGLIILYKALKEPLDLLIGLLKKGIGGIITNISETKDGGYENISYG